MVQLAQLQTSVNRRTARVRTKQEKNWKISFIGFVNPMDSSCPDDTADVPEKNILRLQKAENTRQRKFAARSANSLAM